VSYFGKKFADISVLCSLWYKNTKNGFRYP